MATYTYLTEDFLNKIRNREFTVEEIAGYHEQILNDYKKNGKVWAIVAGVFTFGSVSSLFSMFTSGDGKVLESFLSSLAVLAIVAVVFYVSKLTMIDMKMRQFVQALHKGYPELEEKYGRGSFKIFG